MGHNTAGWCISMVGRRGNGGVEIWDSDTGWTAGWSTETGNAEQGVAFRDMGLGSDGTRLRFW